MREYDKKYGIINNAFIDDSAKSEFDKFKQWLELNQGKSDSEKLEMLSRVIDKLIEVRRRDGDLMKDSPEFIEIERGAFMNFFCGYYDIFCGIN
jgi:hypothetical protein